MGQQTSQKGCLNRKAHDRSLLDIIIMVLDASIDLFSCTYVHEGEDMTSDNHAYEKAMEGIEGQVKDHEELAKKAYRVSHA